MTAESPYITTSELARRRGVDPSMVRRWVRDGLIKPALTTEGGHYRFFEKDFPVVEPHD